MSEFNKDNLANYIINNLNGISLNVNNIKTLLEHYGLTYNNTKNGNRVIINLLNMDINYFKNSKDDCLNTIKEILTTCLKKEESVSESRSDSNSLNSSSNNLSLSHISSSSSSYNSISSLSRSSNSSSSYSGITTEESDYEELEENKEIEIIIPIYNDGHYCTCSLKFIKGKKIIYEIIDPKGIRNNDGLGKKIIEELQKDKELNKLFKRYFKNRHNVTFESSTEYSKNILQKQCDSNSCGYYMVATINDIVQSEHNIGIISKNRNGEQAKSSQAEDKELQTKILKDLDIKDLIKFYGNCVEKGKTTIQPDLDFLYEMVNNENVHHNCHNITISNINYSIISLNGNQYFIGDDNKVYKLILDKENIEFEECFECNNEIINYIEDEYFNKNLEKVNVETLKQITKEDFCIKFVYSVIENNSKNLFYHEQIDKDYKNIIIPIPKNIRIEFLKEFKKENFDKIAEILNIDIGINGIENIIDIITLMCYDLNKEDIKKIFKIDNNKFYEEFYNAHDAQHSNVFKQLIYYCILKSNNIEGIKSQLINDFDNFINNKSEKEFNNIQSHRIEDIEDLQKILNDIEFRKEFEAKNKNNNILDVYNAYINNNINNINKHIELSIGDFYFGNKIDQSYNKDLLLKNDNFVVVDAGNTKGTFDGDALNRACHETYDLNKEVRIFELKEDRTKHDIRCLKQIKKNTCSILEITKNKKSYKMIYLTGPKLSGNNDIKNIDEVLDAYLKALQDDNLNNMTVLFSGISNNLYAGDYATHIKNYGENNFNIVEFYTALYFKTHSSDLEKKKCNIVYTNGISHAMDYINNVLKVSKNKISIDAILNEFDIKNNDVIYTEIENMLKQCKFAGVDLEPVIKQNDVEMIGQESHIPVLENQDINIRDAQREIINNIRNKTKNNNFDILTLININDINGYTKTILDLETECTNIIKECDTDLKRKTDLHIIADTINKTIAIEIGLKKEDANVKEVLDISCQKILNDEQYKKNHSSMKCNNVKFEDNSLSFHISQGGCKDANIKFNVPNGFSKEQVFVLIGCYGLNNVIKAFNKEGDCEIDYNGTKYCNVNEIENNDILKKSFEFVELSKLQDLQNAITDLEFNMGQCTTQVKI